MKRMFLVLMAGVLAVSSVYAGVMPDPNDLSAYSHKKGEIFQFQVTGSTVGSVWGTDLYTLDSRLAAAAVHAGILKDGEQGVVKVSILAGKQSYRGSSKNGVTSSDWGPFEGSYKVEKGDGKASVVTGTPPAPVNRGTFAERPAKPVLQSNVSKPPASGGSATVGVSGAGTPTAKWYKLDPLQKYQTDFSLKPGESRNVDIASLASTTVGFKTDMTEKQVERNGWKNVNAISLSTPDGACSISSWDKGELDREPANGKIAMKVDNQGDIPVRVVIYTTNPSK